MQAGKGGALITPLLAIIPLGQDDRVCGAVVVF